MCGGEGHSPDGLCWYQDAPLELEEAASIVASVARQSFCHANASSGSLCWYRGAPSVLVAVGINIHGTLHAAEFPQGGIGGLLAQRKFAARIDDAPDDHGQAIGNPLLGARIEGSVEA